MRFFLSFGFFWGFIRNSARFDGPIPESHVAHGHLLHQRGLGEYCIRGVLGGNIKNKLGRARVVIGIDFWVECEEQFGV